MAAAPRILVTRPPHQASALADRLRDLGCEPILIPAIETVAPAAFTALDEALAKLDTFHWLLFTSANAVESFGRRRKLHEQGLTHERAAKEIGISFRPHIAVIGPATAHALEQLGLTPDLIPRQAVAESLTQALLPLVRQPDGSPTRFLLIRAEEAREHLPETLRAAGGEVIVAPAYRTIVPEGAAERVRRAFTEEPVDAVTFTSSSTARHLVSLLEAAACALPPSVVRASIGPITSATLRELGFPPHVEAQQATVDSLADALVAHLREHARYTESL